MGPLVPSLKTSLSVLLAHHSLVPATATNAGPPFTRISSAGAVLTNTFGAAVATFFPADGSDAFTSVQLSSLGSFEKLDGSTPVAVHGPLTAPAFSHR